MISISGEEFERRVRRVSQIRATSLTLRRAMIEAHRRGEIPFAPAQDIRSDFEHWSAVAKEQGARAE